MLAHKKPWLACVLVGITLGALGLTSCAKTAGGLGSNSLSQVLAEVSVNAGQVSATKEGTEKGWVCVVEEKHTSVAGQIEIALMLARLHDRYGLRHIALEGLTKDKEFPATKWFRDMGGPEDDELRNQLAVGLLRDGEISAVDLMALVFSDVAVHAADDPAAYRVELTKRAGIASTAYLFKIGLKSVRAEHVPRIQELNQQKKILEMVEYVISLDSWAGERHKQMETLQAVISVEQLLSNLREIESRARVVGAEISVDEREAMSEAISFFEAAEKRSTTMVQTALGVRLESPSSLVAMNIGAAHTEGVKRRLDEAKVTYGVLTPLSLTKKAEAGDLGREAFERKNKVQSVAWAEKGLGSLLDGRRKPPTNLGGDWPKGESQMRYTTALMARGAGGPNFPDSDLKKKIDALDHVKVKWETVKKQENGDVIFLASVLGERGWRDIWTRCGIPKEVALPDKRKGRTLEEMLLEALDGVRKESGERKEPEKGPVLEVVTPDVLAAYSEEPKALASIRISG